MINSKQLLLITFYAVASVAILSVLFYLFLGLDGLYLFALINLFAGTSVIWFTISRKQSNQDQTNWIADDEKYRLLFEQASDYIMVTDFEGNFMDVNESLCRMFGYTRVELLKMNISALIDHVQLKQNPIDFQGLKAGKHVFSERLMVTRDGTEVWVEANVKVFMGDRLLAIARDTTSRKEIEEELRETESKFRNLSERSMVGIYIIQDGLFQYVNPRFAAIFGYNTDELTQTFPVELVVFEDDRETTKEYIRERISGEKQSVHYEVRGLKKDGTLIFIEVFGSMTQYKSESAIVGTLLDVTDKKRAADLIMKEKEFSDLIIKTLPGIFFVRSMTGSFIRWNKNLEIIGGYLPDEVLAAKPYSLIADEDKDKMAMLVDRLFTQGGVECIEVKALKKDGSKIPLYLSATPITIDDEEYVLGIGIDISQQQKIEEELRLSEQKYRLLFDHNPLPMFMTSKKDLSIISANAAATNHYGYTPEDLATMTLKDLRPEDDVPLLMASFVNKTKGPQDMGIWRHFKKDGSTIHVQIISQDIVYQDMEVRLSLSNDITERLKAEEELRNSTANLYSILEVTDIAYVLINKDFKIASFNSKARELGMKELHKDVQMGDSVNSYVPESKKRNWDKLSALIARGQHFDYESSYTQPDGSTNWYQIKLFSVMDGQIFLGMVLAVTDITERKTSDVHRENISLDLLQRNKDLEQFTYIISHNLRAPVANILGICDILQNVTMATAERNEFEQALIKSAGNLDMVIKDLNYILQETTEVFEQSELVSLPELVESIKSAIRDIIAKENVSIIIDFSEVSEIFTLKTYLHSIFYNLIANAIKFRKTGVDPEITISAVRLAGNIVLLFRDNGIGIDLKKNKENLYGLYSRFNFQIPGKGMGLFMVKKQVQILGGKIIVESTIGKGTEFRVELPVGD